jgi:hypothetical protein
MAGLAGAELSTEDGMYKFTEEMKATLLPNTMIF